MQRKSFIQNVTIIVLAVAIILMSVGYAAYSEQLSVEGTTTIERASWDIKFANVKQLSTTTVDATKITGPTLDSAATGLTFGVTLPVNSTYEFTVDVVNNGTFPAELSTYTLSGKKGTETVLNASSGLEYSNDYLDYVVTYSDGSKIAEGDELGAGETKTLKVSVKYTQPDNANQLPSTNESYVFTLDLLYSQK